ncbi:PKD domain-containing protein [Haloarcula pellucida]|uniref:PKD domain-containing protein n=1 Tax=Haloarcula pellucida TaxID=1427151 RepID=A0A830GH73_9EURY|nr:PKD domain-containing protein [Halomicroarcula pellucida]MBX0347342.1 PKD domain-containing protein [Halomicroarcula pellucida]GGN88191.1 hypothetical protein GCM10009030_07650 [Halomicroarcula pellucida]
MERETLAIRSIALVLLVVGASIGPLGPVGSAAGNVENVDDRPTAYSVVQGERCIPLTIVGDASQNVSSYYDYHGGDGTDYSSHGTDDRQVSNVSQLYVYRGSNGDSLLFLHDARNDGVGNGSVSMSITNVPEEASWPVEDDTYQNRDDNFEHGETSSQIDWMWTEGRTDGAAMVGLGHLNETAIRIDPAFDEESFAAQDPELDWPYDPLEWRARSGPDEELVALDKDSPVEVQAGTCLDAAVEVNATTVSSGEAVQFDGGNSTVGPSAEYDWSFGDNTSATGVTTTHTYNQTETFTVTLTVSNRFGRSDTANVTIEVVDDSPPDARLDAPATATPNETVVLDASNSTDDTGISEYRWDVDGDGTVDRTTTAARTETAFDTVGNQTVAVTAVDTLGQTDSANATIAVEANESNDPTAAIDGPATATVNQEVTFDASNSTVPRGGATYEWDLNGDGTAENVTTTPSLTTSFATIGNRTVRVTVVDAIGRNDSANATLTVQRNASNDPVARLDAPATARVDTAVTFDASNSTVPRGGATYAWDLNGDGTAENVTTTPSLTATFDTAGDRTIRLTVTDSANVTATDSAQVTVERASQSGGGGSGGDGGSDSGGGGAAPAPPPEPDEDEPAATASSDGNTVTVESNVDADVVGVGLDDGTLGSGSVRVQRIALADVESGSAVAVTDEWNGSDGPPLGSDETMLALGPSVASGPAPSSVTYQLAIDRAAIRNRGGSVDSLAVATWNGSGWETAETTLVRNDSTVVINATAGPEEPLAVGLPTAQVVGTDLAIAESPVVNQSVNVSVTLSNNGHRDGSETVTTVLGGRVVASERVTIRAGETERLTFTVVPRRAGQQRLTVAGLQTTVDVAPARADIGPPSVDVERETVGTGESVQVRATFRNDGTVTGTENASFVVFGEVVERQSVTVAPGETKTVTFEQRIEHPGQYTVGVNGQNASVAVDGEAKTAQTESWVDTGTGGGGSTSPLLLGLLALGSIGLVAGSIAVLSRQL